MSCFLIIFQEVGVMDIPMWLIIPFAGLLLSIALFPLIKPEWWEKRKPWVVIFWSMLFIIPFAFLYGVQDAAETVLECIANDYLTFIVLLFGLFCVSGNITLEGELEGVSYKKASRILQILDKKRERFYNFYTGKVWGNASNYDLCINSASYGIKESVDLILRVINRDSKEN